MQPTRVITHSELAIRDEHLVPANGGGAMAPASARAILALGTPHGAGIGTLHGVGIGSRKTTRRGFDTMVLTSVEPMSGAAILALREREGISQAVLALHLNVRTKLVSDWERGVKHPSGPSLKLLALIRAKGIAAIA